MSSGKFMMKALLLTCILQTILTYLLIACASILITNY